MPGRPAQDREANAALSPPARPTAHLHAPERLQSQLLGTGGGARQNSDEAFVDLILVLGIAAAQRVQQNLHVFLSLC